MKTTIEVAGLEHHQLRDEGAIIPTVLYLDDDPVIRRLTTTTLSQSGYIVTPVEDGLQAWNELHSHHYDLLITDNEMPRLTGLELATKARMEGMELPIVVASNSANMLASPKYDWLHFAARLQKPFEPDELLETVKRILGADSHFHHGGGLFLPVEAGSNRHFTPYFHWGINE